MTHFYEYLTSSDILYLWCLHEFFTISIPWHIRVHVTASTRTTETCYGLFSTVLQHLSEGTMEISFDESSFLDVSVDVIVDDNNNVSDDVTDKDILPSTSTPIATEKKVYRCPSCPYNTTSRGNLHRHRRSVHQKKKEKCPSCDKTYATSYDLQIHISAVHRESPLMCELCSERFKSRGSLRRHRAVKHSQGCNYVCDTCGKKYYEKEAYIGHINTHIGSKPYSCNLCGDTFGYKSCWRRHMQSCPNKSEKKQHKCDTCGAVLNSRTVLLDHVQGKHGSKLYTCACGKSFSWRPSLSRHKKACKTA